MEPFGSWNHLVEITGRARLLALLVGMLYNDPHLAREAWGVKHEGSSRKALCAVLREDGTTVRAILLGVRSSQARDIVLQRARCLQLECHLLDAHARFSA